jgi:sulfate transport system ATP-binding protein
VLLLDEPFGSLDAKVRKELRRWLRELHTKIHVTSIFVTHDQEEALEVADRVIVMDKGRIQQAGTPQQVYDHPVTPGVHEFIGESIIVPVTVEAGEVRYDGQSLGLDPQGVSGAALLFARPHDVTIVPFSGENLLHGVIKRIHGIGPARRIEVALSSQQGETLVEVDALRSQQLHVGQSVGLRAEQYRLFPSG